MSENVSPKGAFFLYCTQIESATPSAPRHGSSKHLTGVTTEVVHEILPSPTATEQRLYGALGAQAARHTGSFQEETTTANRANIAKSVTPNPSLFMRSAGSLLAPKVTLAPVVSGPEPAPPWYETSKGFQVVADRVLRDIVMSYQDGALLSREMLTDLAIDAMRAKGLPEDAVLTSRSLKGVRSAMRTQASVKKAGNAEDIAYIVPDNLNRKARQKITRRLRQDLRVLQTNAVAIVNSLIEQPHVVHDDAAILQLRGQVLPALRLSPRNNSRYNSALLSLVRADKRLYVYKDQETAAWRYGVRENAQTKEISYKDLPMRARGPYKGKDARRKSISKAVRHRKNQKSRM